MGKVSSQPIQSSEVTVSNLPVTGFGEISTAENRAYIQASAIYNLIPANFRQYSSGTGSSGAENGMFKISTGVGVGGYAAIQSFRSLNYKPGEAGLARFTALFESNAANSWQGAGLLTIADELSFGYNGVNFGIWHRHGGEAEIRTVQITGAAGGSENLTLTLNSVGYTIPLTAGTVDHNAFEISSWLNTNQNSWHADNIGDTVYIVALSDGPKSGIYTYVSGTSTGTIVQVKSGETKVSDFIAQTNWNGDSVDWLNPANGNVYQIEYQYLGFGNIQFFVEDPANSNFVKVHTIKYVNSDTEPSVTNPSFKVGIYAVSLGSTTNLIVKSGSFGAFVQGTRSDTRNPRAYENTQTVSTTFTNILAIRNRRVYNDRINQVEVEPRLITLANESSKNVEVELRASTNPNIELQYFLAGTNLVTDVATDASTEATGRLLASFVIGGGGSEIIDLKALDIRLPPTLHLVVQARVTSGASASVSASLNWYEDL